MLLCGSYSETFVRLSALSKLLTVLCQRVQTEVKRHITLPPLLYYAFVARQRD